MLLCVTLLLALLSYRRVTVRNEARPDALIEAKTIKEAETRLWSGSADLARVVWHRVRMLVNVHLDVASITQTLCRR